MMQRILDWVRDRVFPGKAKRAADLRQTGVRVRPPGQRRTGTTSGQAAARDAKAVREPPAPDLRFDSEMGGRIEDAGPGKNVLVRNKYVREDSGTHEALKIIDETMFEDDDGGIDPYNTGRFDRSKSWNNRSRK